MLRNDGITERQNYRLRCRAIKMVGKNHNCWICHSFVMLTKKCQSCVMLRPEWDPLLMVWEIGNAIGTIFLFPHLHSDDMNAIMTNLKWQTTMRYTCIIYYEWHFIDIFRNNSDNRENIFYTPVSVSCHDLLTVKGHRICYN